MYFNLIGNFSLLLFSTITESPSITRKTLASNSIDSATRFGYQKVYININIS